MPHCLLLIGLAVLGTASAPALAQPAARAPATTPAVDARAVVADVRRILAANYVLREARPKLDSALAAGLAAGRYNVGDPAVLLERINADLSAAAHDKHLGLMHDPAGFAVLSSSPPGAGDDDAPPSADDIRQAVRTNHGIAELKVLPRNLRYMRYNGFQWAGPKTAEAIDTAMRFLRDGEAAIIDLRGNGGGSPDAVRYLVSHFVPANRPLVTFYMRGDPGDRWSSLADLPAGRMVGKPLYVLISSHTGSAAEEFAGHIAGYKLGELIGGTTAGAGFRNSFFPVAGGFVLSVSVGRAVLASTGKDWEGVGIAPTVKVDPDKALDLAQVRALRGLAERAQGDEKRRLEARAALLDAQVNPVAPALPLAAYAGTFGERVITLESGRLTFRRNGGPRLDLVAIGPNQFTFAEDPLTRIQFAVAGNAVTGFELVRGDGSRVTASRTS